MLILFYIIVYLNFSKYQIIERTISMVEIKNLTKYYGKKAAVKDISFTVNDNEILGFLGPNGAGKSTTMNMICGYLPSTSGTVVINGYDISDSPMQAKQCIGYLPELPPVYPDMKVIEYLKFVAGIKRVPKSEVKSQIENAMERLKITDVQGRLIRNLSKGYKQRVGFAQALLGNPEILILDEPTVGLDPSQVAEVRTLIRELKKDHSVILSSHILSEISAVCDRIVVINKGEIQAIDTIANLEESMTANLVLEITVEGVAKEITSAIESVEGVVKISNTDLVKAGVYTYRVEISEESVRNKILSALLAKNANVLEVQTVKLNLEEVFMKLVSQPSHKPRSLKELLAETPEENIDALIETEKSNKENTKED
jgi:ABC-2 type transport system ATP-binding protein